MATVATKSSKKKTGGTTATPQCADCRYARVFADEPLALCLQPLRQKARKVVYAGGPPCGAAIL